MNAENAPSSQTRTLMNFCEKNLNIICNMPLVDSAPLSPTQLCIKKIHQRICEKCLKYCLFID